MPEEFPERCGSASGWPHRLVLAGLSTALGVSLSLLAACQRPLSAQAAASPPAAGIFERERPWSFAEQAAQPGERSAPSTDLSQYLARYRLVTTTLTGTAAGALTGALAVFLVCTSDDGDESSGFLDDGGCVNRDRWFGYVAGGALLGTVLGGARGASRTGGRFGRLSTLTSTDCSFREGLRRAFIGAAIGSAPAILHYATGGDGLSASLLAPLGQGPGALVALWGCIGEPRLGPTGVPPVPFPE